MRAKPSAPAKTLADLAERARHEGKRRHDGEADGHGLAEAPPSTAARAAAAAGRNRRRPCCRATSRENQREQRQRCGAEREHRDVEADERLDVGARRRRTEIGRGWPSHSTRALDISAASVSGSKPIRAPTRTTPADAASAPCRSRRPSGYHSNAPVAWLVARQAGETGEPARSAAEEKKEDRRGDRRRAARPWRCRRSLRRHSPEAGRQPKPAMAIGRPDRMKSGKARSVPPIGDRKRSAAASPAPIPTRMSVTVIALSRLSSG